MVIESPGEGLVLDLGDVGLAHWNRFAAINNEFIPMHMDDEAARAAGFDAAIGMGTLQWAQAHRALRAWLSNEAVIEDVKLRFVAPAYRGRVTVHGAAIADRIDLEVRVDGLTTARGYARCRAKDRWSHEPRSSTDSAPSTSRE